MDVGGAAEIEVHERGRAAQEEVGISTDGGNRAERQGRAITHRDIAAAKGAVNLGFEHAATAAYAGAAGVSVCGAQALSARAGLDQFTGTGQEQEVRGDDVRCRAAGRCPEESGRRSASAVRS